MLLCERLDLQLSLIDVLHDLCICFFVCRTSLIATRNRDYCRQHQGENADSYPFQDLPSVRGLRDMVYLLIGWALTTLEEATS